MQAIVRMMDRRSYAEIALALVLGIAAVSFGRWVIPNAGSSSLPLAVDAAHVLPAGDASAPVSITDASAQQGSFENVHSERADIMQQVDASASGGTGQTIGERQAQRNQEGLDSEDRLAGISQSAPNAPQSNAERLAQLHQDRLGN
jgi:hypothetical protein